MPQKPDAILKALNEGKYSPLYFLHGDEAFYIDQISDFIEEKGLSDAEKGFNLHVMYGKEVTIQYILENARRFPMMAQRQVIIVKEAQEIADLKQKAGQEKLKKYAEQPVPSTVLVFGHKHKKLDARSAMSKALDKFAIMVESKKIYDNQLPDWIKSYCQKKGTKIHPKATQMLADYIGNDLSRLSNEIDKLLISHEKGKEITQEIVTKQVGISKEFNVFELQSALATKNVVKANQIINYFQSNIKNNPIIPMISLLFGFFTKVLMAHQHKGKSQNELASMLKVHPFFMKEYLTATRNYNLGKTVQAIENLHQADLKSKGVNSTISEGELMKELVFKLLH